MKSLAVFFGGAVGALARYGVGRALHGPARAFPWATLVVNLSGAFGLALLALVLTERQRSSTHAYPLIGTGFFGAYTTFSTMAVEGVRLVDAGRVATAAFYWTVTFVSGLLAAVFAMAVARLLTGDRGVQP